MTEKPKLIKGIDIPIRMPSELAAEYEQRIKELEVESANEQERHFRRGYKAAEQELSLKLAEKEQMIKELKGEAKEMAKIAHESVHEHLDEIAEKDKEIERLKKENQYLRAMLSGGATKAIGKLGFALGAACLSNTLSEIDIRKDERNKALSELRDDFLRLDISNLIRQRKAACVIEEEIKDIFLKIIDSRRTA